MGIAKAMHISRTVVRNIRQNLFFAFIYNALGVPIPAGASIPSSVFSPAPMIAVREQTLARRATKCARPRGD